MRRPQNAIQEPPITASPSRRRHAPTTLIAAGAAAIASLLWVPAHASSHREAPFITTQPKVDGTGLYLFNSYETGRSDYVTVLANYQPLQDA